jgi:hypothetical protein
MVDVDTLRALQEVEAAKRECERVGKIAMDGIYTSRGAVFRECLQKLGHDTSALPKWDNTNVAESIFRAAGGKTLPQRRMAADAATVRRISEMFPNANRLRSA